MLKKTNYKTILEKTVFFKQVFLENAVAMLLVRPDNLRIIEANNRAADLLGFPRPELLKKSIYEMNPVKLQAKIKKQFENFKEKMDFCFDLPIIKKNKEKVYAEERFYKFTIKDTDIFVVSIYDMTERIDLERNIKEENHKMMTKTKELLQINRNLISSYEHLKKKFKDFRIIQKQEIINERKAVIIEISEIIKEKINIPMTKILDDILKIKDNSKDLSKESTKRLKMMEEVIENMLTTMSRISEERDIQKMRYVDLENIE